MKYETELDRKVQKNVMTEISRRLGLTEITETGEFAPFDFTAKAIVDVEIKQRNISVMDYETIFVPLSKHKKAQGEKMPVLFVVDYIDAIGVWDIRQEPVDQRDQPRQDRPEDDPVVEYPIEEALYVFEKPE